MSRFTHFFALILLGGFIVFGALLNDPASAAGTIYVDASASGTKTGASWANAYTKLQNALAAVASGDVIWVAAGVYYPDEGGVMTNDDRTATFTLINGVEVYGGFAGTETGLMQRDWVTNVTVLSGDIDQNDTTDPNGVVTDVANIAGSNAYHVVTGGGVSSSAILDGFTVTAGQGGSGFPDNYGGGMYNTNSSPTLTNVSFTGNQVTSDGGGMYNNSSNPTLTNVSFSGNQANYGGGMYNNSSNPTLTGGSFSNNHSISSGGGMDNYASSPTLLNVIFEENTANNGAGLYNAVVSNPTLTNVTFRANNANFVGGGMYNDSSNPTLTNALFLGNLGTLNAGAIFNYNSTPHFINVTISGNRSPVHGGGMFNNSSNPTLTNVILWNNKGSGLADKEIFNTGGSTPSIAYSNVEGSRSGGSWDTALGTDVGNNLDVDPLFVTPVDPTTAPTTAGDLHLQAGSLVVDAGDNGACPAADLDGNPRPIDGDLDNSVVCDMGAYEFQNTPPGLLLNLFRSPASITKGSGASGQNQWFTRVTLSDHTGDPGLAFHYVVWLHVPEDWTLPWATQYSFAGDFANTTLSPDWTAQSWVQHTSNCPLGGASDAGFKWRAFQGPQEALPALGNRLDNRVNLRGGLGVPGSEISQLYGGVRVIVGTYYDFNPDGTPDRYVCDHIAVTTITITD